ncbi:molybdopterin molybdotransferase MoeA [Halobacteria archaeon AArc-dxtr1]|nr:molybdopterin molybdotransferase MoeA [Halobacteria archaeon AArc-dxtr1]
MSDTHADLVPWTRAAARVGELRADWTPRLGTERVSIDEIAGRTLAEDLSAPRPIPAASHATMDGFAFDATDDYPLEVVDGVFPEDEPPAVEPGTAVRIATGAPVPDSANVVLKREEATVETEPETGTERLSGPTLEPGTYVYEEGSNVAEGEVLFEAGERLGPKDALLLGELDVEAVRVRDRLSTVLLATGTEIHEGRMRDLDSPMLAGLVRSWGHEAAYEGTVPDEYDVVEDRIAELAERHDVVITTGGTSVGEKDYVIRALDSLGEVLFHRVALRPGKPIAVARLPDQDAVAFAIPGKPLGAYTVTTLVARPFFAGPDAEQSTADGADDGTALPTVPATIERDVGLPNPDFAYAVPVTLTAGRAMPLGHRDSALSIYDETFDPSVLSSSTRATRADGFVLTETALEAGEPVDVVPYQAVER